MDLGSSSQETVSSVDMESQPRGATRGKSRETGPPGGVDFMCGLDYDSSQASGDNTVVSDKKRILRLVINDDEESPHDVNRLNNIDSDTDLPDI